jgi:hypothetical protein
MAIDVAQEFAEIKSDLAQTGIERYILKKAAGYSAKMYG